MLEITKKEKMEMIRWDEENWFEDMCDTALWFCFMIMMVLALAGCGGGGGGGGASNPLSSLPPSQTENPSAPQTPLATSTVTVATETATVTATETSVIPVSTFPTSFARTVSSHVVADETWSGDILVKGVDSNGHTTIQEGTTVTVQPGSRIYMERGVKLVVRGKLLLDGSASNRVLVTTAKENPTNAGMAMGITWLFGNSTLGTTVSCRNVDFEYLTGAVAFSNAAPNGDTSIHGYFNMSNCSFSKCMTGLLANHNQIQTVSDCAFEDCGWAYTAASGQPSNEGAIKMGGGLTVSNCSFKTGGSIPVGWSSNLAKATILAWNLDETDPSSTYTFQSCSFDSGCNLVIYNQAGTIKTERTLLFSRCSGAPLTESRPTTGYADSPDLFVVKYE